MNEYVCFYKGRRIEVQAETSYQAQQKAAKMINVGPRKQCEITVVLAEKDGEAVTHTGAELP